MVGEVGYRGSNLFNSKTYPEVLLIFLMMVSSKMGAKLKILQISNHVVDLLVLLVV